MLPLLALSIALIAPITQAQGDVSSANNVTDLSGTWSSNVAVSTGNVSDIDHADLYLFEPTARGLSCLWCRGVANRDAKTIILAHIVRHWELHRDDNRGRCMARQSLMPL